MENKAFYVAFNHIKGIGSVRLNLLTKYFNDLAVAWQAPYDALRSAGLSERIVENLISFRRNNNPEELYASIVAKGTNVIILPDAEYPKWLHEIEQPPPVLYVRGSFIKEDEWAVSIVGTRRMTGYGRQVTTELSSFLAQNGITVISGLARGVDATAHTACLQANGRTIAVLGNGVDIIYPAENRQIAQRIIEQGALVSDYPPGTPPDGSNFPPRNRIISGLSVATVIVEAGINSGALITSTFAAEQGREVFAVPGGIYAPQSKGTNYLIQQGARPLLRMEDILDVLQLKHVQTQKTMRRLVPENETESRLLDVLGDQPLHIDEIQNLSQMPIEQVSATLVLMELKGLVYQASAMHYVLTHEDLALYGSAEIG